jgi:transcriptional regulator with XRE-family HTH domain
LQIAILILQSAMNVGEKLRYLRHVEGTLRGFEREMTQQGVSAAIDEELGERLSQSYLSQIERGQRRHLTNTTRLILSRFFKVHPGYLVDDPDGFHTELVSEVRTLEDSLDLWLISGAERFRRDAIVSEALLKLAMHPDSRQCLALVSAILETPSLAERLLQVLKPEAALPEIPPADSIPIKRTAAEKRGKKQS